MSLFQVREFVAHNSGGMHLETAFIAADNVLQACQFWQRETNREPHDFMFISTNETAIMFGCVVENVQDWAAQSYSESQFAKWRHVNVGRGWLPLKQAMREAEAYAQRIIRTPND